MSEDFQSDTFDRDSSEKSALLREELLGLLEDALPDLPQVARLLDAEFPLQERGFSCACTIMRDLSGALFGDDLDNLLSLALMQDVLSYEEAGYALYAELLSGDGQKLAFELFDACQQRLPRDYRRRPELHMVLLADAAAMIEANFNIINNPEAPEELKPDYEDLRDQAKRLVLLGGLPDLPRTWVDNTIQAFNSFCTLDNIGLTIVADEKEGWRLIETAPPITTPYVTKLRPS